VDTNILLRYLLNDIPHQHKAAKEMLAGIDGGEAPVFCDPAIIIETVHGLRTQYHFTPEEIAGTLLPLVEAPGFIVPDKDRYVHALELYGTTTPHFGDACACAAAMEQTEGRLYSFDKKLSRVEGVTRLERALRAN